MRISHNKKEILSYSKVLTVCYRKNYINFNRLFSIKIMSTDVKAITAKMVTGEVALVIRSSNGNNFQATIMIKKRTNVTNTSNLY